MPSPLCFLLPIVVPPTSASPETFFMFLLQFSHFAQGNYVLCFKQLGDVNANHHNSIYLKQIQIGWWEFCMYSAVSTRGCLAQPAIAITLKLPLPPVSLQNACSMLNAAAEMTLKPECTTSDCWMLRVHWFKSNGAHLSMTGQEYDGGEVCKILHLLHWLSGFIRLCGALTLVRLDKRAAL